MLLILHSKIETDDYSYEHARLFERVRGLAPQVEILGNDTKESALELLLTDEECAQAMPEVVRLRNAGWISYSGEACSEAQLQQMRLQVLQDRIARYKPVDIPIGQIKDVCRCQAQANGVDLWSNGNIHYIVADGRVFERYGFWGIDLFNYLAHGRYQYDLSRKNHRLE